MDTNSDVRRQTKAAGFQSISQVLKAFYDYWLIVALLSVNFFQLLTYLTYQSFFGSRGNLKQRGPEEKGK